MSFIDKYRLRLTYPEVQKYSQVPQRCGIGRAVLRQDSVTLGFLPLVLLVVDGQEGNMFEWLKTKNTCVPWVSFTKTSVSPDIITGRQNSIVKGHGFPEAQLSSHLEWTTPWPAV